MCSSDDYCDFPPAVPALSRNPSLHAVNTHWIPNKRKQRKSNMLLLLYSFVFACSHRTTPCYTNHITEKHLNLVFHHANHASFPPPFRILCADEVSSHISLFEGQCMPPCCHTPLLLSFITKCHQGCATPVVPLTYALSMCKVHLCC